MNKFKPMKPRNYALDEDQLFLLDKLNEVYAKKFDGLSLEEDFLRNEVQFFIFHLDYDTVYKAMEYTCTMKQGLTEQGAISYFCKICWNKKREKETLTNFIAKQEAEYYELFTEEKPYTEYQRGKKKKRRLRPDNPYWVQPIVPKGFIDNEEPPY